MLTNIIEQLVLPVVERRLADAQFIGNLALGEAVGDQAEDSAAVGHDTVQILEQARQHELIHNAVFEGCARIGYVKAEVTILGVIAVRADDAVYIEDIAGDLVDTVAAVAIALGVIVAAAAVVAAGLVALFRHPTRVIQVDFF